MVSWFRCYGFELIQNIMMEVELSNLVVGKQDVDIDRKKGVQGKVQFLDLFQ